MIVDSIVHASQYGAISPVFTAAIEFLQQHQDGDLPEGRYPICQDAYALVKRYRSKSQQECHYEAHRDSIDVQYVAAGQECIGWAPKEQMEVLQYQEERDQYRLAGEGSLVPLAAKQFMILFPQDAHMPCVCCGEAQDVIKIILKIRVPDRGEEDA